MKSSVSARNGIGVAGSTTLWRFPAGYQSWRSLLFAHWPVAPEVLRPVVPPPLSIDTFDGVAYVGVIPFVVSAARPPGAPPSLGLSFLETNARTYVTVGGQQPGVYFFSLDAASLAAVVGARAGFGLPYYWARMSMDERGGEISYETHRRGRRPAMLRARYEVGGPIGSARPETLDHFLIERYVLHVRRGPTLWTVRVRHHPYPLHAVKLESIEQTLVGAAGLPNPTSPPPLVHYASGVDVEILAPRVSLD